MALSMGTFAAQPITTPALLPYNFGPSPLNNFYNAPYGSESLKQQQLPWQQDDQQQSPWDSLERLVDQNKYSIYGNQQYLNSNQQKGQSSNQKQNNNQQQEQNQHWTQQFGQYSSQSIGSDQSDKQDKQDNHDEKDELEEWQKEKEEEKEELFNDFQFYLLMLYPFLIFDKPTATYFAQTELLGFILNKLGVPDDDNLLFLLFVQCIDIVALSRGRLKFVEGYKQNWYQEIYDYTMTKLDVNDIITLGTQMLMPQSPAPEYEEKK